MAIPSEALRKCKHCGEEKEPQHMVHSKPYLCKACNAAKTAAWRKTAKPMSTWTYVKTNGTPEDMQRLRERHRIYQKKSDERRFAKMSQAEILAHKADLKAKKDKRLRRLKDETYAAYGGAVCRCCGEREPTFLSIDHVDNDGYLHRKEIPKVNGGYSMYVWLKRQGFPPGFQILCMNCQVGKHRNGGVCPHQRTCDGQGASPYPQAGGSASGLAVSSVHEMTCSHPKG